PIGGSGSAATGALRAVFRFVEIGLLNTDVFPVDVEFIGDDHGKMGLHTLTDFGILRHDGDDAVCGNTKERSGQEGGGRGRRSLARSSSFSQRLTTMVATPFPITLVRARHSLMNLSMPTRSASD